MMKKLYFVIVSILIISMTANAQLNLTLSTHGIVPGDQYKYFYADTINFNIGSGGSSVTWTDTGLTIGTMLTTVNYIDPKTTLYASSFPLATYATNDNGKYTYYKAVTAGLYILGVADSTRILNYPDDEKMHSYPFYYNLNQSDYFSGSDTVKGNRFPRNGKITSTADATGTLNINGSIFTNVLRVKFYEETSDYLIKIGPPVDTFVATHYKKTIYQWYRASSKVPLINYIKTLVYQGHNTVPDLTTTDILIDYSVTGINSNKPLPFCFSVFPNPANGIINLESNFSKPGKLTIEVVNATGDILYSDLIQTTSGSFSQKIDLSGLTAGIYSIRVANNEMYGIRKLIIQ